MGICGQMIAPDMHVSAFCPTGCQHLAAAAVPAKAWTACAAWDAPGAAWDAQVPLCSTSRRFLGSGLSKMFSDCTALGFIRCQGAE